MEKIVKILNAAIAKYSYTVFIIALVASLLAVVLTYIYKWYFTNFLSLLIFLPLIYMIAAKIKGGVFISEKFRIYLKMKDVDENEKENENEDN